MSLLLVAIFFILGLVIGSFLNVVIYRLNTKKSLGGRSACMSCGRQLLWHELLPIISFLSLGGRCRGCKTKISIQYPLVELISGVLFSALFLKYQDIFFVDASVFTMIYAYYTLMFSILLIIAVYDLKHKIIPDTLSFAFGILAFVGLFFFKADGFPVFAWHFPLLSDFLAGLFSAFPFFFFWVISAGRWMGLGDAKLALSIGWLFGMNLSLSSLVLAFWFGAIVGLGLVFFGKKYKMKSEIPFAPFLVLGAFLVFIFEFNFFGF